MLIAFLNHTLMDFDWDSKFNYKLRDICQDLRGGSKQIYLGGAPQNMPLHQSGISLYPTMTCLGLPVLPNDMIDALTPPGPLKSWIYSRQILNYSAPFLLENGWALC